MFYPDRHAESDQRSVRELPLLEGESIEEQFVPNDGLVSHTPLEGQLLVLTNRRAISFVQSDGQNETLLASLGELKGVSVKANTKNLKSIDVITTSLSRGMVTSMLLRLCSLAPLTRMYS